MQIEINPIFDIFIIRNKMQLLIESIRNSSLTPDIDQLVDFLVKSIQDSIIEDKPNKTALAILKINVIDKNGLQTNMIFGEIKRDEEPEWIYIDNYRVRIEDVDSFMFCDEMPNIGSCTNKEIITVDYFQSQINILIENIKSGSIGDKSEIIEIFSNIIDNAWIKE